MVSYGKSARAQRLRRLCRVLLGMDELRLVQREGRHRGQPSNRFIRAAFAQLAEIACFDPKESSTIGREEENDREESARDRLSSNGARWPSRARHGSRRSKACQGNPKSPPPGCTWF